MGVRTTDLQPVVKLQRLVEKSLNARSNVKVLEAGCGSYSYMQMPANASCYIVGIDISKEQLEKNSVVDEKILGDIQVHRPLDDEFDVIVCWWVLEHLPHPEKALDNFLKYLKEGGILILAVPNVFSLKGLITKFAPHWFHTWVYGALYGVKDYSPFRTFLRFSISPRALRRFAASHGLSTEYSCLYANPGLIKIIKKYRLIYAGWCLIRHLVKLVSLGKIDVGLEEYLLVLKK